MPAKMKGKAAKGKGKAKPADEEEIAEPSAPPQEMIAVFDLVQAPHPPFKKVRMADDMRLAAGVPSLFSVVDIPTRYLSSSDLLG
jgi:hypothetical protein